jgi:ribonuclease R
MKEQEILDRIARLPHGRATYKQLVRELGARGPQRQQLEDLLARLVKKGALIELRSGQYVLPGRTQQFATGRLSMHRDGYGFVSPAAAVPGIEGDIFIPPDQARHAMHGDTVLARITRVGADGRAEGEVIRVLGRAHPTVTGEFKVGRRQCYVVPFESRIRHWVPSAASSRSSAVLAISAWTSRSSSASTTCPTASRPRCSRRPRPCP